MKKKILITLVLVILSLTNVFAFSDTNIIDFRADESNYTASQASKINLPFVRLTSKKVVLDTDTNKSGICFAGTSIELTGKLSGVYLLTAGEEVVIKGEVDNVIVSAPKVRVEGKVNGILVNLSDSIEITEKAEVNEIYTYSSNLILNGKVKENLLGTVNSLTLKGNVEKDVRLNVEKIDIDANKIKGNVYFKTHNENLNAKYVYPNAKIDVINLDEQKEEGAIILSNMLVAVISSICIYSIIEIITKRKFIANFEEKVTRNLFFAFTISLASFMLTMPIMFFAILLMSVGFFNIAIAVLAIYIGLTIATAAMSLVITGAYISKFITRKCKINSKFTEYLVVTSVYVALYFATKFVFILAIFNSLFAFGITFTYLFKKEKNNA